MSLLTSIKDIDLSPLPGKQYFNTDREWREEFIYFLMVDRFHDDWNRPALSQFGRTNGFPTQNAFYGGNIKGITNNLDYIAGLGCTAIWLSPFLENNGNAYHGYDINNYLGIDPRFGTLEDLVALVNTAHAFQLNGQPFPIRIIMDVVINHSGNNWFYQDEENGSSVNYSNDDEQAFGGWRRTDRPLPVELRNEALYHKKGSINSPAGWDNYPENQHGDPFSLKDFANDDDEQGAALINILIKSYCYWIREADIDGFRVDAVKHMGELACSRFCSNVREYAYSLGKRGFFLFGELAVADDDIYNRYIGSNTSTIDGQQTVFFGINSLLDFRLAQGGSGQNGGSLRNVLLGNADPKTLFNRLDQQANRALNRGELGRYLISFVDNHDSFWQPDGRIGFSANDDQVIASVGFLLCNLGTACIYYGTEQGFSGQGNDENIREAMYDNAGQYYSLLNRESYIYQQIAQIARVMRNSTPLRFGRMYYRQISGDGEHFGLPYGKEYTLAFSRLVYGKEVLVAYNVSGLQRQDFIIVDASLHPPGSTMQFLYGGFGSIYVQSNADGTAAVQLLLNAHQFVILQ